MKSEWARGGLIDQQTEQYKRGQILGFTMAEIMLVLLFLLLLMLGTKLGNLTKLLQSSIPSNSAEYKAIAKLQETLDKFNRKSSASENKDILWLTERLTLIAPVVIERDSGAFNALVDSAKREAEKQEFREKLKLARNEVEALKKELATTKDTLDESKEKLADTKVQLESYRGQYKKLLAERERENQGDVIGTSLSSIMQDRNIALGEARQCLLNCGGGPKACWGKSLRKPDFIYNVALYDTKLFVTPDLRSVSLNKDDWESLPSQARIEVPTLLSQGQFREQMSLLLSHAQANDCVFQARLVDVDTSDKETYKIQRRLVEGYMYPTPFKVWNFGPLP